MISFFDDSPILKKLGIDAGFSVNTGGGPAKVGPTPGPQGTGGKGGGVAGIQKTYSPAAEKIATMQRTLIDLATYVELNNPGTNKGTAIHPVGFTQSGKKLDAADDGVWGINTENALKKLNDYITKFHRNKNIGQVITNKIAPNAMSQVQVIDGIVNKNLSIIAKVFAAEGNPAYMANNLSDSEVLDKLPNQYSQDDLTDGNIPLTVGDLRTLLSLKQKLGAGFIKLKHAPPEFQNVLKGMSQNSTRVNEQNVTGNDIVDFVESKNAAIATPSKLYTIERDRVITLTLTEMGRRVFAGNPGPMQQVGAYLKAFFDQRIQSYQNTKQLSAELIEQFYQQELPILFKEIRQFLNALGLNTPQANRTIQELLQAFNSQRANVVARIPFMTFDLAEAQAKEIRENPQVIMAIPGLDAFLATKQSEAAQGGATAGSWSLGEFRAVLNWLALRATSQINKIKGGGTPEKEQKQDKLQLNLKQKYLNLVQKLIGHLGKLETVIVESFGGRNVPQGIIDGVVVPDQKLEEAYRPKGEQGRQSNSAGGLGRSPGTSEGVAGVGNSGAEGDFGTAGGQYGESGKAMGPPNWKTSTPVTIGNTYAIHLRTLGRWSSLGGGLGAENIPGAEQMPSLNYGLFSTGDPPIIVEQLINVFGNKKDAAAYLKSIQSMLRTAMTGWVRVGQQLLDDGKISESQMNETMSQVSQRVGAWHKALSGAAAMIYNSRI